MTPQLRVLLLIVAIVLFLAYAFAVVVEQRYALGFGLVALAASFLP